MYKIKFTVKLFSIAILRSLTKKSLFWTIYFLLWCDLARYVVTFDFSLYFLVNSSTNKQQSQVFVVLNVKWKLRLKLQTPLSQLCHKNVNFQIAFTIFFYIYLIYIPLKGNAVSIIWCHDLKLSTLISYCSCLNFFSTLFFVLPQQRLVSVYVSAVQVGFVWLLCHSNDFNDDLFRPKRIVKLNKNIYYSL